MRPVNSVIDVVILSWNRLENTLEAISSVRDQVGVAPRIWVVDQGSEPDCIGVLREWAKRDSRIRLRELGRNLGVAAGRNRAMALGSAEYIVAIDNDAVFQDKHALGLVAERFREDPELAVVAFRIKNYHTGQDDRLLWVYPRQLLGKSAQSFRCARFAGCGHGIRRSVLAKTRGYDERLFFFWEELDLSYQLIELGYRILYDPTIVVLHKVSPERRTSWKGDRFYFLVRNALYLDWKYFRSPLRIVRMAIGYQFKGLRNGVVNQAVSGTLDAFSMMRMPRKERRRPLSKQALGYLWENDLSYRGSEWRRLWTEVFEKLPG